MKFLSFVIICLGLLTYQNVEAQSKTNKVKKIETCEFSVKGVCGMCEKRIEKAALIKGVKLVEWDKESQTVKVMYATKKVSEQDIHQAIADAGHDTEKLSAPEDAYQTLPDCCAYRDGVKVH